MVANEYAPGLLSTFVPPAASTISGNQCPEPYGGSIHSAMKTRGRLFPATAPRTASTFSRIVPASAAPRSGTPSRSASAITLSTTSSNRRGFIDQTSAPTGQAVDRSSLDTAHTAHRSWVISRSGFNVSMSFESTAYSECPSEADEDTSSSICALVREETSIRVRATSGFCAASGGQLQSSETPTTQSSNPSSAMMSVALGSKEMIRTPPTLSHETSGGLVVM